MKFQKRYAFTKLTLICGLVACCWFIVLPSGYAQTQNDRQPQPIGSYVVTGKLQDYYGPIVSSEVYLNSMKDEDCAKLFQKLFDQTGSSRKDRAKFKACVSDVGPVEPNSEGVYTFSNLKPGYYALVVSWNTKEKFEHRIIAFDKGDFGITYYEGAKYNAVSTGRPFYFSGDESLTKDFDFTKGVITKMTRLD